MADITAQEAAQRAMKQKDSCEKYRDNRLSRILEMNQAYYGKFRPSPRGRSGIPMPFFAKYVDEVKARVDNSPIVKFHHGKDSQIMLAKKVQGACEIHRSPSQGDWNRIDRQGKFMSIFSGVIVYDKFAERNPKFHDVLEAIAIEDFYFEATGGNNLEDHAFVGKGNIFRSKSDLEALAESGVYDKKMVASLLRDGSSAKYKELQRGYINRYEKFKALGLDMSGENYIGEDQYALAQWQMTIGGKRYLLTFDMIQGHPVRFVPLKEVWGSNLYSMVLAQTHEDPHTVLCKSPADDMWPIAEWLRVQANYLIDHATKQIWGQTVYDPNFIEGAELEWQRPGQLSIGRAYQGQPLEKGIFQITTPDKTVVTIDMMKYFEDLMASVVGVAPQDATEEQAKVAVMFGNLQKVSAKLGVYNHSYSEAWNKLALRYVWGLKENMDEKMMVKLIGDRGVEWDELAKNELTDAEDMDLEVVGAEVELEMSEARKMKQNKAISDILSNPTLLNEFNVRVLGEEIVRTAGFKEETIRRAMDKQSYGSERIVAHAAMAIELILRGKKVDLYRGADISFLEYINDFAVENDLKPQDQIAIIQYGRAHIPIVVKNMALKASTQLAQKGVTPDKLNAPGGAPAGASPAPAAPGSPLAPPGAQPAPGGAIPPQNLGRGAPPGVVPSMGAGVITR